MRTYTHGVIGYLLYATRSRHEQQLAIIGGVLPDVVLAICFIPHYVEDRTRSSTVAALPHRLHYSALHIITVSMHSFVMVGALLGLSYVFYKPALPCFVGMLAHGLLDFLTHSQWAYNHCFPLPLPPIRPPVS